MVEFASGHEKPVNCAKSMNYVYNKQLAFSLPLYIVSTMKHAKVRRSKLYGIFVLPSTH
jgi:hypothetical protein